MYIATETSIINLEGLGVVTKIDTIMSKKPHELELFYETKTIRLSFQEAKDRDELFDRLQRKLPMDRSEK